MTNNELALLLVIIGAFVSLGSGGIVGYMMVIQRLTRVETLVESWGSKTMNLLHSPDDHLGLDFYIDEYRKQNFDLKDKQWVEFKELVSIIEHRQDLTKETRLLAAFASSLCDHKLSRGKLRFQEQSELVNI